MISTETEGKFIVISLVIVTIGVVIHLIKRWHDENISR